MEFIKLLCYHCKEILISLHCICSSTRVRHRAESMDEMGCSPFIWRSFNRQPNGGMKFVAGENGRNSEKNLPRLRFVHHETQMEWRRRKLGTSVVGGERLTACSTETPSMRTLKIPILCICVLMPTHCTITCFGFHARWIDGVQCGLFSNHAPLGQTTLRVGWVSV